MSTTSDPTEELKASARAHSDARNFELSIPIWQRLVERVPSHWGYWLDLVKDLRGSGNHEEADNIHE